MPDVTHQDKLRLLLLYYTIMENVPDDVMDELKTAAELNYEEEDMINILVESQLPDAPTSCFLDRGRRRGKKKGVGAHPLTPCVPPPSPPPPCFSLFLSLSLKSLVHGRYVMTHPVMDKRTLQSQAQYHAEKTKWLHALEPLSGTSSDLDRSVFLAGAYLHHGFHEDGFRSGIEVSPQGGKALKRKEKGNGG